MSNPRKLNVMVEISSRFQFICWDLDWVNSQNNVQNYYAYTQFYKLENPTLKIIDKLNVQQ